MSPVELPTLPRRRPGSGTGGRLATISRERYEQLAARVQAALVALARLDDRRGRRGDRRRHRRLARSRWSASASTRAIEGVASVIIIWRFTGTASSPTPPRSARRSSSPSSSSSSPPMSASSR